MYELNQAVPFPDQGEMTSTKAAILDAAITSVKREGWARVTLGDIARQAGVTRPTVYSYFSNRDEVVRAALLQSAYAFGARLMEHLALFPTDAERVTEAVLYSLRVLPDEPCLALITDPELTPLVNAHTLTTPEGLGMGTAVFRMMLPGREHSDDEMEEMAEFSIRFMISLLTMSGPRARDEAALRGFIQRRLLPGLGLAPGQEEGQK